MTNIKAMLVIIRTWRSHFDNRWPLVNRVPHPLGRIKAKPSGHLWIE